MRNLRERVKAMGGQLAIESVTGEGTTVKISLPL
jgi:signal transduction histidine kinase